MAKDRSRRILELVDLFIDHVGARGQGWDFRFATKFGVIYAAMQIATDADVLPWPSTLALKVASKCIAKLVQRRETRTIAPTMPRQSCTAS